MKKSRTKKNEDIPLEDEIIYATPGGIDTKGTPVHMEDEKDFFNDMSERQKKLNDKLDKLCKQAMEIRVSTLEKQMKIFSRTFLFLGIIQIIVLIMKL